MLREFEVWAYVASDMIKCTWTWTHVGYNGVQTPCPSSFSTHTKINMFRQLYMKNTTAKPCVSNVS